MKTSEFYNNKVVIITGASMGIGKQLAKQILLYGGKVVITGRSLERLEAVEEELSTAGKDILIHAGDCSDFGNNELLMQKTIARFGKLDVLINNAGLSGFAEVSELKPDITKQIIDTNIYGSLFPTIVSLPELQKTNGAVLFVSSIACFQGIPQYSTYCLSKKSLMALAQSLYIEQKGKNVFVGISYLGFVENDIQKKTIAPGGELIEVPKRPKLFTKTREKTAIKMLRQIKNKKHSVILSNAGRFARVFSFVFPGITRTLFVWKYNQER